MSLMIEEANKISAKLRKNTVFSRYDKTRRLQNNSESKVVNILEL